MNDEPWYQDGLQFSCTGCGNCCTGPAGYVWVTDDEIARIAELQDKPIGEIRLFHTRLVRGSVSLTEFANGDCTFFDPTTRKCKVYTARPTQCRTWPFWRSNLRSEDAWNRVCEVCPGSGNGNLIPLEQIEAQVSALEL